MSKYKIAEYSYNIGCDAYACDTISLELLVDKSKLISGENIIDDLRNRIEKDEYSWPSITVNTNGFSRLDKTEQLLLLTGRRNGKTMYMANALKTIMMNINFYPVKVIFNDPATIVFWDDGTKTVVKCQPGDTYNPEMGLALCFSKKALGNKSNFNNVFKKWIKEDEDNG